MQLFELFDYLVLRGKSLVFTSELAVRLKNLRRLFLGELINEGHIVLFHSQKHPFSALIALGIDIYEDIFQKGQKRGSVCAAIDKGDFEVATTYVLDYHTRVPEILIMSEIASYMVSAEDLEIIKQCAKDTQEFEKAQWALKEVAAEEIVRGNGNTIVELTAEEMAAYEAKMAPLYEEFGANYTDVIEAIKAVGENF